MIDAQLDMSQEDPIFAEAPWATCEHLCRKIADIVGVSLQLQRPAILHKAYFILAVWAFSKFIMLKRVAKPKDDRSPLDGSNVKKSAHAGRFPDANPGKTMRRRGDIRIGT
ncbi:6764_t:CDS:2 [Paraglomus brasilianum]|uniref:6764_t:CDS:1 n=1 Tax=Paraglomus brasilianum TaxID=144538 RepID=A0A9N9G4L5_9GLOM|nr:6764_t:CDS:2 [Paraglomus brasilianum]